MPDNVDGLRASIAEFARDREWDQFHTPKNLAMALAAEAGEVLAELQWLTDDQIHERLRTNDDNLRERIADELGDVLIYLIRLADVTGIDLVRAAEVKLVRNADRYPVELARGNAIKYNRRDEEKS